MEILIFIFWVLFFGFAIYCIRTLFNIERSDRKDSKDRG